jgi:cellulose synthase/poly-beta-1,6-N-acetylglucosamine synthase-like glycosyltransferase
MTRARSARTPSPSTPSWSAVVPTLGRPSLHTLLVALAGAEGPKPDVVVVVDDRVDRSAALDLTSDCDALPVVVVSSGGRGPAAARNAGWRRCRTEWVAFLDDDVVPGADWPAALAADLDGLPAQVAGSQGRVRVPLPSDRRPTDWERTTAGLEHGRWITADMAYRRSALDAVGGFDERFPRAFREDSDLALRVVDAGYRLVHGSRQVSHPVRPADRWVSVRVQAGNADDVLMRRLHGPRWRERSGAGSGTRATHVTTTLALAAAGLLAARRSRWAVVPAAVWAAGTARFAWQRVAPGPRTASEVVTMLATSVAIGPVATRHWLRGLWGHRHVRGPGATPVRGR